MRTPNSRPHAATAPGKLSKAEVDIFVAQVNADTEAIAKARAVKAMKPAPPKRAANPLFKKRGKTTAMKSSSAPRAARPTPPKVSCVRPRGH